MYEKKVKKITVDWKSLIIKIIILLVVLCLIIWIISLFKKDNKNPSNISENLTIMKNAATEYFVLSRLPKEINEKNKITLEDMINNKLIIEVLDQNGKACNKKDSYAEVTKINDENYTIKVKLVCGKESDYIIDTLKIATNTASGENTDENQTNDNDKEPINPTPTNPEPTNPTPSTPTSKPSTNKPTPSKPSSNNNNNANNSSSSDNKEENTPTTPSVPSCQYGSNEYISFSPLAYAIEGPCAASKDDYGNAYINTVSEIGIVEYKKLSEEISALAKETGKTLYVESPKYIKVSNIAGTGIVGYQILMTVKFKDTYSTESIYEYYLDTSSNRHTIFDNRGSLYLNY